MQIVALPLLSRLLRDRRLELNRTQPQVAARGQFENSNASRWENGTRPNRDKLERIAAGYDLPLEVIVAAWSANDQVGEA